MITTRSTEPAPLRSMLAARAAAALVTVFGERSPSGADVRTGERRPGVVQLAVVLVAALVASACTNSGGSGHRSTAPVPLRSATVNHLSGNELRYGAGFAPNPAVVYQPDAVMIGGGAGAVRAVSAAGLTWTIDANAPGANQLAVGKIMLATSFGTGRVLKLTRSSGEVQVVLGPVAITDVIRDADLGSSTPIPIGQTLAYATPTAPGAATDDPHDPLGGTPRSGTAKPGSGQSPGTSSPPGTAGTHSLGERRLTPGAGAALVAERADVGAGVARQAAPTLPAPSTTPSTVGAGDFQVTPFCCDGGAGIGIGYDKRDGRLQAKLTLKLEKPTALFILRISGGKLSEATVQVHGAGAVSVAIDAATLSSAGNFSGKAIHVPETLTIPLAGFGVPLVLSLNQDFYMTMQLIGAAEFHTKGGYSISGDLGFGYRNGSPSVFGTTLAVADPMTANTRVLGVASGVITVGWNLKVSVGVGVLGFSAGVWYQLGVALSVVADGLSLTAGCVRDALLVTGRYGVGWTVPKAVVNVINFFLKIVQAKPIAASGGPAWGPTELWRPTPGNFCRKTQS